MAPSGGRPDRWKYDRVLDDDDNAFELVKDSPAIDERHSLESGVDGGISG